MLLLGSSAGPEIVQIRAGQQITWWKIIIIIITSGKKERKKEKKRRELACLFLAFPNEPKLDMNYPETHCVQSEPGQPAIHVREYETQPV
jgi:hypothetical protein